MCKLGKPCAQKSGKDPSLRLIRTLCWHSIVHKTITNLIFMMYLDSGQLFAVVEKILFLEVWQYLMHGQNSINQAHPDSRHEHYFSYSLAHFERSFLHLGAVFNA